MELRNELVVRQEQRLVKVIVVSSICTVLLGLGFFFASNMLPSSDIMAAGNASTYVISGSFNSSANQTIYQNAVAGDTIKIQSTVTLDQNSSDLQSKNVIILIEAGVLNWTGNSALNLSAGGLVLLKSGGTLSATGCNANPCIAFAGVKKVSCNGGGADLSFAQVNSAGGVNSGGTSALPVELIRFDVARLDRAVQLTWATASEINNSHFEIERSLDGDAWVNIGQVKGHGNANHTLSYKYNDEQPVESKVAYYRLKQVDFDGVFEYSFVRAISNEANTQEKVSSVYPNPADKFLHVKIGDMDTYQVIITDQSGQIKYQQQTSQNVETIPVGDFQMGVYYVVVQNDRVKETHKVLIKH